MQGFISLFCFVAAAALILNAFQVNLIGVLIILIGVGIISIGLGRVTAKSQRQEQDRISDERESQAKDKR